MANWWWNENHTWTLADTNNYWPWNYFNSSPYYIVWYVNYSSTQNPNLWWDVTNTSEARQWPCKSGYHVPSKDEWLWLIEQWQWWNDSKLMANELLLPKWACRDRRWGLLMWNYYWSSTAYQNSDYWYQLAFNDNWIYSTNTNAVAMWSMVRCFKK